MHAGEEADVTQVEVLPLGMVPPPDRTDEMAAPCSGDFGDFEPTAIIERHHVEAAPLVLNKRRPGSLPAILPEASLGIDVVVASEMSGLATNPIVPAARAEASSDPSIAQSGTSIVPVAGTIQTSAARGASRYVWAVGVIAAAAVIGLVAGRLASPPESVADVAAPPATIVAAKADAPVVQAPAAVVEAPKAPPQAVAVPPAVVAPAVVAAPKVAKIADKKAADPIVDAAPEQPMIVDEPPPAAPAFDPSAAQGAISSMTSAVHACADGTGGVAHVSVTFAPSGKVTRATVDGAPFAGTPVGSCIASTLRGASIPAFSGAMTTVTKTFSIN